jgi:hypothetical protein
LPSDRPPSSRSLLLSAADAHLEVEPQSLVGDDVDAAFDGREARVPHVQASRTGREVAQLEVTVLLTTANLPSKKYAAPDLRPVDRTAGGRRRPNAEREHISRLEPAHDAERGHETV